VAAYEEQYPVGCVIRIRDSSSLQAFAREWRYHNPLRPEQLAYAGALATVEAVGFYHGGDVLYELVNIPGIWHEGCLESADS
jgi:hypothetical protein